MSCKILNSNFCLTEQHWFLPFPLNSPVTWLWFSLSFLQKKKPLYYCILIIKRFIVIFSYMHVLYFEEIHLLSFLALPYLLPLYFTAFNGIHFAIFIHTYNVFLSYSPLLSPSCMSPHNGLPFIFRYHYYYYYHYYYLGQDSISSFYTSCYLTLFLFLTNCLSLRWLILGCWLDCGSPKFSFSLFALVWHKRS
jgi:hypothetical protein